MADPPQVPSRPSGDPSGIDRLAPARRPDRRPVGHQTWLQLAFLHWPAPAADLARLLPPGLAVDRFAGTAYVALVPFTMRGVRPAFLPAVPGLSDFHEFNLRTYVVDRDGRPGVWFFSLDAASRVGVALGRLTFGLPYRFARMDLEVAGDGAVRYRSRRPAAGPAGAGCDLAVRPRGPAAPAVPGTLEHFLVERYYLFTTWGGRLCIGQVHHPAYRIRPAELLDLREDLLAAAGLVRPPVQPLVHHSDGVQVDVFGLRPVR